MADVEDTPLPADIGDVLVVPPPAVDETMAGRIARDLFDIDGAASRLTSERDANFLLESAGRRFVLKIANAAESERVTDLQTEALLHIEQRDPNIPVPRMIRTTSGRTEAHVVVDGRRSVVRVVTFLDGEPLHRLRGGTAQVEAVARALARLSRALRDFDHPGADHDLLWDIANAARLRPLTRSIADAHLRALATGVLDRFEADVLPVLPTLRRQVVHNDFNPHNILVAADDRDRVAGIIDFGDIVRTTVAADVAVAAAYQLGEDPDPVAPLARFAAAYASVDPLSDTERDLLVDLVPVRLVATLAITAWRAARHPENADYILRNTAAARRALERFAAIDRPEARRRIRLSL